MNNEFRLLVYLVKKSGRSLGPPAKKALLITWGNMIP
jgi:hypothetical protein